MQNQALNLPLNRIHLYQHGMGLFEHQGTIEGNQLLALSFQQDEMNDVLRSLSVLDLDGGSIGTISYPARISLSDHLAKLPLHLNPEQPWKDVLKALRGQRIRLKSTDFNGEGVFMGLDNETQATQIVNRLLLNSDGNLRRIDLNQVQSLEACEQEFQELLTQWLRAIAGRPERPDRQIRLSAIGQGKRRLAISYSKSMPGWRMAYRLFLKPDDDAVLQAWALLDNPSLEDWNQVRINLLSGKPGKSMMAFETPEETYEYDEDAPPAILKDFNNLLSAADDDVFFTEDCEYGPSEEESADLIAEAKRDLRAHVKSIQTNHLVEYQIEQPISLAAGQSALVHVLSNPFPIERLLTFRLDSSSVWPQAALRFSNSLSQVLDKGPVVVQDDSIYAGEGDLRVLAPGESQVLEYGAEQRVTITNDFEHRREKILSQFKLQNGYVQSIWTEVRHTHLEIVSSLKDSVCVRLTYPIQSSGQSLRSQDGISLKRSKDQIEIEFNLASGEARSLELILDDIRESHYRLYDIPENFLKHITDPTSREVLSAYILEDNLLDQQLLELSIELDNLKSKVYEAEAGQERLLKQMQSLGTGSDTQQLRSRWLEQLIAFDAELDSLRQTQKTLETEKSRIEELAKAKLKQLFIEHISDLKASS